MPDRPGQHASPLETLGRIIWPENAGFCSAAIFTLFGARWATGLPVEHVQLPYFYLTYAEGFTRRGLVGTLTYPLLAGLPVDAALAVVAALCLAATAALLAGLAWRLRDEPPVVAMLLASNALPMLARDLGMLDVFGLGLVLLALALVERADGFFQLKRS